MLVFLSGEREIRDVAEALTAPAAAAHRGPAALRAAVRGRAAPGLRRPAGRRIVLATNVAETSLTVPGIRYVVDPGTARISRYSARIKVQRLPIEPISQASATSGPAAAAGSRPGVCIRLYSEDDFAQPAGVHRAGDPADQPGVGDPADGRRRLGAIATSPSSTRPTAASRRRPAAAHELGALVDPGNACCPG